MEHDNSICSGDGETTLVFEFGEELSLNNIACAECFFVHITPLLFRKGRAP